MRFICVRIPGDLLVDSENGLLVVRGNCLFFDALRNKGQNHADRAQVRERFAKDRLIHKAAIRGQPPFGVCIRLRMVTTSC